MINQWIWGTLFSDNNHSCDGKNDGFNPVDFPEIHLAITTWWLSGVFTWTVLGLPSRRLGESTLQLPKQNWPKNWPTIPEIIELDDGNIYRKALYLMVKTMVSCRFSLKPIQWKSQNRNRCLCDFPACRCSHSESQASSWASTSWSQRWSENGAMATTINWDVGPLWLCRVVPHS